QNVRDVNGPAFEGGTSGGASSRRRTCVPLHPFFELWWDIVDDRWMQGRSVGPEDHPDLSATEPRSVLDESLQNRLKVERRPTNHLEHFARRGLLLEGFAQLTV